MSHTTQTTPDQKHDNTLLTECTVCAKPILIGDTYVSINRNFETTRDYSTHLESTVSDSVELLSLCEECGKQINEKELIQHIASLLKFKYNCSKK